MSVGFKVKFYWYQVGSADFLFSFFSTVACNLENGRQGERFPMIKNLCDNGRLEINELSAALEEIALIKAELKRFSADKVVWDMDDLSKQPPWGSNISPDITDLSNYFVTSDGEDFITVLQHAVEKAVSLGTELEISNL
ncbi:MAG: immunity 70 family protein [Ruminococcus sp.]|uniref:immunity 70 family protein n=1 Tax=Ruminococcus sp. TaxID=41978 RepID=UPI0025D5925D|nr:immunity 70 family protein [Ruminococcus sp.]MBR5682402.1 immunity 70 family protein [Ruminococcus sp.]